MGNSRIWLYKNLIELENKFEKKNENIFLKKKDFFLKILGKISFRRASLMILQKLRQQTKVTNDEVSSKKIFTKKYFFIIFGEIQT